MAEDVAPAEDPDAGSRLPDIEPAGAGAPAAVLEAEPARPIGGVTTASRADRARRSAYRARFVVIYFVLALLTGAALGALVVVVTRPESKPPPPWSKFVPDGSASARLFQIVDQVPKKYRRQDGQQLVSASVDPPQAQLFGQDGSTVLVPINRLEVRERGDITVVDAGSSVQFSLCGQGQNCALEFGKPSLNRYSLLQREALELSLYALKYVRGLESVTVLLPPSASQQDLATGAGPSQQTAIFLRRKDVARILSKPLRDTLPATVPKVNTLTTRDKAAVRKLGSPHTFGYRVIQSQDGTWVRVFEPTTG